MKGRKKGENKDMSITIPLFLGYGSHKIFLCLFIVEIENS